MDSFISPDLYTPASLINWPATDLQIVRASDGILSHVKHGGSQGDHSRSSSFFDYHVDGAYLPRQPDICALYCLDAGRGDIATAFVDSRIVLACLDRRRVKRATLGSLAWSYRARDGRTVRGPLLRIHPRTGEQVLYYGRGAGFLEPVRSEDSPLLRAEANRIQRALDDEIASAPAEIRRWTSGKLLFWDNWTFLHARLGNLPDPRRHLVRAWYYR